MPLSVPTRFRSGLLPLLCLTLACVWSSSASAQGAMQDLVIQAHGGRSLITVAVPPFEKTGAGLEGPIISQIVTNDLNLCGFFKSPDNPQFAQETERLDASTGSIHFAEWNRIGVAYLVKGSYTIVNNEMQPIVKIYDARTQTYVTGRKYNGYSINEVRDMAHAISNDIIERLTLQMGVADTKIAFIRATDPYGKTKQVSVMDADGQRERVLTGEGELTATPCWGANGTEIYYTTYRDFNPDLEGIILRTNARWWVSRRNGFNLSPAWNATAKLIALTFTKDGNSEIYTIDREGKDPRRLTINRAIDSSPSWSPDGTKIAFTSDRTGDPQLFIMDVRTLDVRRLTFEGRYNDSASWSPDGKKIAYCSRRDSVFQIYTINPDGSENTAITSGPYNNEDPSWAPNSLLMAFTSDRTGSKAIYTMFADGGNLHKITTGKPAHSPAWGPK